jgi:hypothetical protein
MYWAMDLAVASGAWIIGVAPRLGNCARVRFARLLLGLAERREYLQRLLLLEREETPEIAGEHLLRVKMDSPRRTRAR